MTSRLAPFVVLLLVGLVAVGGCGEGSSNKGPGSLSPQPTPQAGVADLGEQGLNKVYLADLPEFDAKVGWGTFTKGGMLGYGVGFAVADCPIRVGGNPSPKGLSMHPGSGFTSTVKYRLNRAAKWLRGSVALSEMPDNYQEAQTPVTFRVVGDGRQLWASPPIQVIGRAQACLADVSGVDVLELLVDCPGQNVAARAVWLDPYILH